MRTIAEAHVYVTQELQRQGAYKKDRQYPQAIDFALNKAMIQFIRSSVKPAPDKSARFEISESSRQDIQKLIVLEKSLRVTKLSDFQSASVLPPDFLYLLGDTSNIIEDCKKEFFKSPTETVTERVYSIVLKDSSTSPYYKSIVVKFGTNTVNINTKGFDYGADKVYVIDYILDAFKSLGLNAYWESYKDIFIPGAFLVPTFDLATPVSLSVDAEIYPITFQDLSINRIKTSNEAFRALNRSVINDYIGNLLLSFYGKSISTSPISTIAGNSIFVYCDKSFLPTTILIDYIRLPRPVNLSLNHGFELHPSTHDRICDIAVERLKKRVDDPSFQAEVEYNQLKN